MTDEKESSVPENNGSPASPPETYPVMPLRNTVLFLSLIHI